MKRPFLLFLLLFSFACSDEDSTRYCDVENPVDDLEWLHNVVGTYQTPSTYSDYFLYQAVYIGQPVFYISTCCPSCNVAPPTVMTCSGDVAGTLGVDIDSQDLRNQKIIWRTNHGVCP